jgi:hypothetical protein
MLQYDSEGNSSGDSGSEEEGEGEYEVDDGDSEQLQNSDGSPADAAADDAFWNGVAQTGAPAAQGCTRVDMPRRRRSYAAAAASYQIQTPLPWSYEIGGGSMCCPAVGCSRSRRPDCAFTPQNPPQHLTLLAGPIAAEAQFAEPSKGSQPQQARQTAVIEQCVAWGGERRVRFQFTLACAGSPPAPHVNAEPVPVYLSWSFLAP